MSRRKGTSWRAKLSVLIAAFAIVPLIAYAAVAASEQTKLMRRQTITFLQALGSAKADAVDQFAESRRSDAERFAQLLTPFLVELEAAKDASRMVDEPEPDELPELQDGDALDEGGEGDDEGGDEGDEGAIDDGGAGDGPAPDAPEPPAPAPAPPPEAAVEPPNVDVARAALRRAIGLLVWDLGDFEEILVLDREGRVQVSSFEAHERHDASELRYFEMGRSSTYLEPVFLSPLTGELTMVISSPMRDANHELVGVLAARLNLKRFFQLLNDSTGLGETGEIVTLHQDDNDTLVFTTPTRHRPDAALATLDELGASATRPHEESARGMTGAGRDLDYRGVDVLAAWYPIPSLEWGLVVKIDEAEAMAPVDEARRITLFVVGALLVLASAAAYLAAAVFMRPLRDLRSAADRISRGDFQVSLDIRSRDEIGELADSFERMIAAIKFFREQSQGREEDFDLEDEADADGADADEEHP